MTGPSEREESAVADARRAQMARWQANWTELQAAEGASSADTAEALQALIDTLHLSDTIDFLKGPHVGRVGLGLLIIQVALMTSLTLVAYILGLRRRFGRYWQSRRSGKPMGQGRDHDTPG